MEVYWFRACSLKAAGCCWKLHRLKRLLQAVKNEVTWFSVNEKIWINAGWRFWKDYLSWQILSFLCGDCFILKSVSNYGSTSLIDNKTQTSTTTVESTASPPLCYQHKKSLIEEVFVTLWTDVLNCIMYSNCHNYCCYVEGNIRIVNHFQVFAHFTIFNETEHHFFADWLFYVSWVLLRWPLI